MERKLKFRAKIMETIINKIEYYLPESILLNMDLEKEFPEWNAEKIEKKTGVKERHVVKELIKKIWYD